MSSKHVYLSFDFQDREGSWVRSFSFNKTQFHTKACVIYEAMLTRCADGGKYKKRFTTYTEAISSFSSFQHFAVWCQAQKGYYGHDGKKPWCLDKDILLFGNKVYSPETCTFVPEFINGLFSNKMPTMLPLGVTKHLNKYRARCSTLAGRVHLGCFTAPMEAHKAWQMAKSNHIYDVAQKYLRLPEMEPAVFCALIHRSDLMKENARDGIETSFI